MSVLQLDGTKSRLAHTAMNDGAAVKVTGRTEPRVVETGGAATGSICEHLCTLPRADR